LGKLALSESVERACAWCRLKRGIEQAAAVYLKDFIDTLPMEPERINAIAANLQDLARRAAELRRYL